jgi:hypothetical protein
LRRAPKSPRRPGRPATTAASARQCLPPWASTRLVPPPRSAYPSDQALHKPTSRPPPRRCIWPHLKRHSNFRAPPHDAGRTGPPEAAHSADRSSMVLAVVLDACGYCSCPPARPWSAHRTGGRPARRRAWIQAARCGEQQTDHIRQICPGGGSPSSFFARNFSGSFLELGIGPEQVNVGRAEIQQFIPEVHFGRLVRSGGLACKAALRCVVWLD